LPRQHRDFSGLPLEDRLKKEGKEPRCMIQVSDLQGGTPAHRLSLGGVVRELYDIACLPGLHSPMAVGFAQDQINRMIRRGPSLSLGELARREEVRPPAPLTHCRGRFSAIEEAG
jgi:hypothetical protein